MWWPLHFDFLPYVRLRGGVKKKNHDLFCFWRTLWTCELSAAALEKGQWFIEENWIAKPFSSPKSTAWLSLNNWLFISFHHTQRPNPETTWATNVGCGWDHHWMCHSLLTTHKTHWLQLYEVKILKKRKMRRRCPQSFLKKKKRKDGKKSCCIWILGTKSASDWNNSLGHLLSYVHKSGTAVPCFSTTDPCILLCEDVRESV